LIFVIFQEEQLKQWPFFTDFPKVSQDHFLTSVARAWCSDLEA